MSLGLSSLADGGGARRGIARLSEQSLSYNRRLDGFENMVVLETLIHYTGHRDRDNEPLVVGSGRS
jgi:hypothetical protein